MRIREKFIGQIALLLSITILIQSCDGDITEFVPKECDCIQYTYKYVAGVGTVLDKKIGIVGDEYCNGAEDNPDSDLYMFEWECFPF